ncbi:metalloregulator ArsR/SmtB family transcription factor [Lentibacter algarum]|uniref:ArsR/SmtB family transcription factor n=1 Tax=Lentibacter algarum TaxID=576131 RepID=UPI001C07BF34|nr:metalloregulator ArsR/SmtB family transcription factor [Lentibacter algarum]MBU2981856.1 metalloregulator ArsR/SmtB family transcription factor [Lentibacter algarum]
MSNQTAFRALADPTRRDILTALSDGEMTVKQLTERFPMTRAAVKKHLVILEVGGLLTSRKQGRETLNKLNPEGLKPVTDWLAYFDQFWDTHLTNLQSVFDKKD